MRSVALVFVGTLSVLALMTLVMVVPGSLWPFEEKLLSPSAVAIMPLGDIKQAHSFSFSGPYVLEINGREGVRHEGPSKNTPQTSWASYLRISSDTNRIMYGQNPGPRDISFINAPNTVMAQPVKRQTILFKPTVWWENIRPTRLHIQTSDSLKIQVTNLKSDVDLSFSPGFLVRMIYQPDDEEMREVLFWHDSSQWLTYAARNPLEEQALLRGHTFTDLAITRGGLVVLTELESMK